MARKCCDVYQRAIGTVVFSSHRLRSRYTMYQGTSSGVSSVASSLQIDYSSTIIFLWEEEEKEIIVMLCEPIVLVRSCTFGLVLEIIIQII